MTSERRWSDAAKLNSSKALVRFEFLEALCRIGVAKFLLGGHTTDVSAAITMLCGHIEPFLDAAAEAGQGVSSAAELLGVEL